MTFRHISAITVIGARSSALLVPVSGLGPPGVCDLHDAKDLTLGQVIPETLQAFQVCCSGTGTGVFATGACLDFVNL